MEEEKKDPKKTTQEMQEKVKCETEKLICEIIDNDLQVEHVDLLGKLIDIHKDLANENYWKIKEEKYMRYKEHDDGYGDYPMYGRRMRDSRGRYTEGNYGRRGVPGSGRGRYRGEEMMDEMAEHYDRYSEGKEEMEMGNYGAEDTTMKSLDYMLQSVVDFMKMLKKDAGSQEEMELIKHYSKKISEM